MSTFSVENHVIYALRNARRQEYPFPHFYVKDVFPIDFYLEMTKILEKKTDFHAVEGRFAGRTFATPDDIPGLEFMKSRDFLNNVMEIFAKDMKNRYVGKKVKVYTDLRLVRDGLGYQIGPHTDALWKMVSLLFYIPRHSNWPQYGTSLYVPKDPNFRCPGGPHHDFDHFHRIATMPYYKNCCFGFWKTDNSFHGVEEVTATFNRDVLLYNIYDEEIYLRHHQGPASAP